MAQTQFTYSMGLRLPAIRIVHDLCTNGAVRQVRNPLARIVWYTKRYWRTSTWNFPRRRGQQNELLHTNSPQPNHVRWTTIERLDRAGSHRLAAEHTTPQARLQQLDKLFYRRAVWYIPRHPQHLHHVAAIRGNGDQLGRLLDPRTRQEPGTCWGRETRSTPFERRIEWNRRVLVYWCSERRCCRMVYPKIERCLLGSRLVAFLPNLSEIPQSITSHQTCCYHPCKQCPERCAVALH